MTNDPAIAGTNDERMSQRPKANMHGGIIWARAWVIPSSLGIRHSSFVIRLWHALRFSLVESSDILRRGSSAAR